MDKVLIKRAKRNKKKPTLKEKVLAGVGLGSTFIGGAAGMSRGLNQQRMVSSISRDQEASSKKSFGDRLKSFFTIPKAKAEGETDLNTEPVDQISSNIKALIADTRASALSPAQKQEILNYFNANPNSPPPPSFISGSWAGYSLGIGDETPSSGNAYELRALISGYKYESGVYRLAYPFNWGIVSPIDTANPSVTVMKGVGIGFGAGLVAAYGIANLAAAGTISMATFSSLSFVGGPVGLAIGATAAGIIIAIRAIGPDPRAARDSKLTDKAMPQIMELVDAYNRNRAVSLEEETWNHDKAVEMIKALFGALEQNLQLGSSRDSQRRYVNDFIASMDATLQQRLSNFRSMLANTQVNQAPDGSREAWVDEHFGWVVVYADGTAVSEKGKEVPQSLKDAIRTSTHVNNVSALWFNPQGQPPSGNPTPGEAPPQDGQAITQERVLQIINAANTLPYANLTALEHSALNAHLAQNPNALTQKNFATFKRGSVMAWALGMGTGTSLNNTAYALGFASYDQARDEFNRQLAQPLSLEGVVVFPINEDINHPNPNIRHWREGVVPGLGRISVEDTKIYNAQGQEISSTLNPADVSRILIYFANNQHLSTTPSPPVSPPAVGVSNLTFRIVGGSTLPNNNAAPHPVAVGQSWEIQITGPVGAQVTATGGKKTNGVFPTTATPSGIIPANGVLVLNGTFAAEDKGEWRIAWQVGSQTAATIYFNLQDTPVPGSLGISTNTLSPASVGQFYNQGLTATGGSGPYRWNLEPGSSLPPGLSLSQSGGIMGIPTTSGSTNFMVRVRDSQGASAIKQFSLAVLTAPPLPPGLPPGNPGNPPPTNPNPPPVVVAVPVITQITPSQVSSSRVASSAGEVITILGSNFNSSPSMNMVFFGNTMTTASQVVPGGVKVKIPTYLTAGSYKVKVANISDIAKVSNELNFTITGAAAPAADAGDSSKKTADEQAETEIYGIPKDLQAYVFGKLPKTKAWSQFKAWTNSLEGKKNFVIKGVNPKTGEAFRLVVSRGQARHIVEHISRGN